MDAGDLFRCRVALSHMGRLINERHLGYIDPDNGITAERYTAYGVGFISKLFTAIIILMAEDEGPIQLIDKLSTWFFSIPNAVTISIENLQRHTSDICSFMDDANSFSWNTQPIKEDKMVAKMVSDGPVFEPGAMFLFSTSNYFLQIYIREKIYRTECIHILSAKIMEP